MDPLDTAKLIEKTGDKVRRDSATGLYVLDATVPPTLVTLAEYERGMRVLHLREKASLAHAERAG
jgi:hypothetical protein